MRNKSQVIFLILIFAFNFNLSSFAQTSSSSGGVLADDQAAQAIEELKTAINNAKEVLSQYPAGQKLLQKIADAKAKLIKAIDDVTPQQCSTIYTNSITRLDTAIGKIESKGCTTARVSSNKTIPKCIPQETLDQIMPQLKEALASLKLLGEIDLNRNKIPDFCDNNF